jgi:predicted MFS family arabinose efflux permease
LPTVNHINSKEFNIPNADAGTITYLTQAGYAIGLFLMVPLGDKIERKSQIYTTFASVIALIIAATAQSYFVLEIASLLIELLL